MVGLNICVNQIIIFLRKTTFKNSFYNQLYAFFYEKNYLKTSTNYFCFVLYYFVAFMFFSSLEVITQVSLFEHFVRCPSVCRSVRLSANLLTFNICLFFFSLMKGHPFFKGEIIRLVETFLVFLFFSKTIWSEKLKRVEVLKFV